MVLDRMGWAGFRGCSKSVLSREARGLSPLLPLSEAHDVDLSLTFQTAS
jgi:hypothetical protein